MKLLSEMTRHTGFEGLYRLRGWITVQPCGYGRGVECTELLSEMTLHGNFDTIAVRVHFGANGCIRVHFVPVFVNQ